MIRNLLLRARDAVTVWRWNRAFKLAPERVKGDSVTETLAAFESCPFDMLPCRCLATAACSRHDASISAKEKTRRLKVETGRRTQFLRQARFFDWNVIPEDELDQLITEGDELVREKVEP